MFFLLNCLIPVHGFNLNKILSIQNKKSLFPSNMVTILLKNIYRLIHGKLYYFLQFCHEKDIELSKVSSYPRSTYPSF